MEGLTEIIVDKNLTIFILHILNTSKPLLLNYSKTRIQTTKDSGCFARFCFSKASVTNEGCLRGKHLFSAQTNREAEYKAERAAPETGSAGAESHTCVGNKENLRVKKVQKHSQG